MSRFKGTKGIIVFIIIVFLIVGYYFYLSNRQAAAKKEQEAQSLTVVQDTLLRDLNTNYPPTPKEVIKYYSRITQCFYNEEYTEEELKELALKAQELFDDELIQNKKQEQYLTDLQTDIETFKSDECTIPSYSISSSTDVEYFSEEGYDCARLYCIYSLKQGSAYSTTQEIFVLRKDDAGHWKILGWNLADLDS